MPVTELEYTSVFDLPVAVLLSAQAERFMAELP